MVLVYYTNWCMRAMGFSTGIQSQRLRKSVENKKSNKMDNKTEKQDI